jgi:hypothetical protein
LEISDKKLKIYTKRMQYFAFINNTVIYTKREKFILVYNKFCTCQIYELKPALQNPLPPCIQRRNSAGL